MTQKMTSMYNTKLKQKILFEFSHRVIPGNILPAIKKYDSNVLTDRDMEHIRTTTRTLGNIQGAEELLHYMCCYDNWFPCLMQALKDPDVKHAAFAANLENIKAELDHEEAQDYVPVQEVCQKLLVSYLNSALPKSKFLK
ncbi:hypothetical protein ElyMa_005130600 [Elysia marginata]|uniref:Caspase recruitment domain-containing protein n=1 Tax=Elysia marginata TaxID=1093978 RepID=A0AAV4JKT3_9GAST|nr:hypothetical protein ElyMa_005130600 [Elysia marginata]